MIMKSSHTLAGLALAMILGLASPAAAELLLYEPFNYTAASSLNGSGGAELGFDGASTWSYGGSQTYNILAGSVPFDTYATSGNKANYVSGVAANTVNEAASRPIDFAVSSGDLWFSFLTQSNVASVQNGIGKGLLLDESNVPSGGGDGRDFSLFQKTNATTVATMTYGNSNGSTVTAFNDSGVQYLVIGKFSDLGTPGASAKMWGVTALEYATLRGDFRISEAELNSVVHPDRQATAAATNATTLVDTGFLNMISVDVTNVANLDYWVDEIRVGTQLAEVALLATAPTTAVTKLSDTFNDLIIPTNLYGDGDGFVQVTNGVNGFGMVSEAGGQAVLQTSGFSNNTGIVSVNSLQVEANKTVTVHWDIASAANLAAGANGIELLIQGNETFRGGNIDFLGLSLRPNDIAHVWINGTAAGNIIVSSPYTLADALDGFTATLTANASGWQFEFTGLGSLTSLSGGYGSGNFLDIFNDGRVAATIQGSGAGGIMYVNEISAQVTLVPEPSSLVMLLAGVIGAIGCLRLLRNRRSAAH